MGVVDRNAKLAGLQTSLGTFGAKERLRLEKEAVHAKIVQSRVGIDAVRSANLKSSTAVATKEVNSRLGT